MMLSKTTARLHYTKSTYFVIECVVKDIVNINCRRYSVPPDHCVLHLCVETIFEDCHTPPNDTKSINGTHPKPDRKLLSAATAYTELKGRNLSEVSSIETEYTPDERRPNYPRRVRRYK